MSETAESTGNGKDGDLQPPRPIGGGNPPPAPQERKRVRDKTNAPTNLQEPTACAALESGEEI